MNKLAQKLIWQICFNGYKIKECVDKNDECVYYNKIIGYFDHIICIYTDGKIHMFCHEKDEFPEPAYDTGFLENILPEQLEILITVFNKNYK